MRGREGGGGDGPCVLESDGADERVGRRSVLESRSEVVDRYVSRRTQERHVRTKLEGSDLVL